MPSHDLVLHGHFYQPPRENPWTDEIDPEPSAAPFANWNERITSECYLANAHARVLDDGEGIADLVNGYAWVNFDFGPTLLRWLQVEHPQVLQRLVEADAQSLTRLGHGNAIAQAYNHVILPLAHPRDRATQIRWGLAEFRHRFGRDAEALWCPETAVDDDVLAELIDHGMQYVILSPRQAKRVRETPDGPWQEVSETDLDTSRAYRWMHPDGSGRWLALFFYHGRLAAEMSFGDALKSTDDLLRHCEEALGTEGEERRLVHAAADGETAGHHTAWGDRVLAHALSRRAAERGWTVTNYAAVLEARPPTAQAEIDLGPLGEGSAWSCAHGVGRWIRDCGCRMSADGGSQAWRTPLREALDLLRDRAAPFFEEQARPLLRDPWAARDAYVQILLQPTPARREAFLAEHAAARLDETQKVRALSLLEFQHQLMLMYTSCGWFFDDVAGLEAVQILRYAARALEIWQDLGGTPPREEFEAHLARAESNDADEGDGRQVFLRHAITARVDPPTIALQVLTEFATAAGPDRGVALLHEFRIERARSSRGSVGRVATGVVRLRHLRTGAESSHALALWHPGGATVQGCAAPLPDAVDFQARQDAIHAAADHGGRDALQADLQTWFGVAPVEFGGIASRRRRLAERWLRRLLVAHAGDGGADPSRTLAAVLERAARADAPRQELLRAALHLVELAAAVDRVLELELAQNAWYGLARDDDEELLRVALGRRLGFAAEAL